MKMAVPEKLQLNILHKIHGQSLCNEQSSSESDSETETGNSFGTSRSGSSNSGTPRSGQSDTGTPRSLTSESSSTVTTPRANLLWDHGFDVARNECKSPEERDMEWRRFSNKTDDDKIIADRRMKIKEIAYKLEEINLRDEAKKIAGNPKHSTDLPDLIPSTLDNSHFVSSSQETLFAMDDLEIQRGFPDGDAMTESNDSPPPLPCTSPPRLDLNLNNTFDDETFGINEFDQQFSESEVYETEDDIHYNKTQSDNERLGDLDNETSDTRDDSGEDCSSSAAGGDLTDQENDSNDHSYEECYNVQSNRFSESMDKIPIELAEDVEAEFDFILQSLNDDKDTQDTYIDRLAYRRDRYGFILSPVIEAPSPTPSNFSNYSGYSGISCSSPDPLGNFRMSPGPIRGSKHEIDLSSLCVNPADWEIHTEQTVPIYQTAQAKKAFAFPEGYGWDSGDDLLSPTGSVEWEADNNGLSTPPVSTNLVNLTQFGTHITGWKQPDVAIYEESETDDSDATVEGEEERDSDTTVDNDHSGNNEKETFDYDESPRKLSVEEESPRNDNEIYFTHINEEQRSEYTSHRNHDYENVTSFVKQDDETNHMVEDEEVQTMELSLLEDEIKDIENEINALKMQTSINGRQIKDSERDFEQIKRSSCEGLDERNINVISLESSLDDSFCGFSDELAALNKEGSVVETDLETRCRKPIPKSNSKQSVTDDESEAVESDEDAEDELSESDDDDNKESDFEIYKVKSGDNVNLNNSCTLTETDEVSVSEILSPRSAILMSGGMFPEETESSTFTSDEDAPGDITPDPNMSSYGSSVKVMQYTSGDSDDSSCRKTEEPSVKNSKFSSKKILFRQSHQALSDSDGEQDEHCGDITQPFTIHSQLDFTILDSKLDLVTRGELRKSPRIFGRYYAEMDKELVEQVRAHSCPIEIQECRENKTEFQTTATENYQFPGQNSSVPIDLDEFESSFKNIEFSHPNKQSDIKETDHSRAEIIVTEGKCNEQLRDQSHRDISKDTGESEISLKTSIENNINTQHSASNDEDDIIRESKTQSLGKEGQSCNKQPSQDALYECEKVPDEDDKLNEHIQIEQNTLIQEKKVTKESSLKYKKSAAPVKIKVGHLQRTGSARMKVKQGFVHELSALFSNKQTNENNKCDQKKVKNNQRRIFASERIPTPKLLTPNENMVVNEREASMLLSGALSTQESLGFDVTPMVKVASFDEPNSAEETNRIGDDEQYADDFLSSESGNSSEDNEDADLKQYENQLRDIDNNDSCVEDLESNIIEKCENEGTKEFIPRLNTLSEIKTKVGSQEFDKTNIDLIASIYSNGNESNTTAKEARAMDKSIEDEEEIEENIEGDTDPNQGEDEEFHEKYHLSEELCHRCDSSSESQTYTKDNNDRDSNTTANNYKKLSECRDPNTKHNSDNDGAAEAKESSKMLVHNTDVVVSKESQLPLTKSDTITMGKPEIHCQDTGRLSEKVQDENTDDFNGTERSSLVLEIPWKPLKLRKKEAEKRKSNLVDEGQTDIKKKSGYLYNLINRLNSDSTSKPKIETVCENAVTEKENVNMFTRINEIIERNTQSHINDKQCGSTNSFQIQDKATPTAMSETGEFEILDDEPFGNSAENATRFKHWDHNKIHTGEFDDPKYLIRYPSSLSKRLYGPYCRLREKETTLENVNEIEAEGDTNLTLVYCNSEGNTELVVLENVDKQNSAPELNQVLSQEQVKREFRSHLMHLHSHNDENYCKKINSDNLPINQEEMNLSPTDFNHTSYDVKSQSLRPTQRDCIKFGFKPIMNCKSNEAKRKSQDGENNFVNVNLQQTTNEAETDKQGVVFAKADHYGNENWDVNLRRSLRCPVCESLDNLCDHENGKDINHFYHPGKDSYRAVLKNDDNYSAMGVHIPHSVFNDERKQENVDMNNDFMSNKGRQFPLNTNLPRINYTVSTATTENISSHLMSAGDAVTDDKRVKHGDNVSMPEAEAKPIRTSVVLQTPGFQHVLEDEKGKLKIWPYSDFEDSDRVPVTLHKAKRGINIPVSKGMSNKSKTKMTVIQSAGHSAERPENKVVQKYHSSSVLPADRTPGQMMKAHGESVQSVLLQDANGNAVSEEEIAAVLPKIAETISKMDGSNVEEILPGITQSITKLKNGGNLVITTMTRKLDEEESGSSGRGSPEPDYPVLDVEDLEKSKIYLVQDSKGELFYVEDVTSDTQESAYFSSSRHTSENVSEAGNSPTFERISKINTVGSSGINASTAEEILKAMYEEGEVREMAENEEEWSERTYEYDIPRRKNYSKDAYKTSYMVEEPGDSLPRLKTATANENYESSYNMSGGAPWVYDGGMAQSYSQVTQQNIYADDANSVSAVSTQPVDISGVRTIERYTIEGEAVDYPMPVPQPPVFVPPMVMQTDTSQYSLVKVAVTPKQKDEGVMAQIEAPKPEEPTVQPIYKTVAHIQTADKQPSPKPPVEKKKYKIISSKASQEEEQETHMSFEEMDYKFSTENVEYKMRPATTETQYFVKNTTKLEPKQNFRSEKRIDLGRSADQKYKSQISVQQPKPEVYEENSYTYDQMKSQMEQSESNIRVVRGSYLIKNTLNDVDTTLDDNINMFDGNFTLCKDNPLYKSDEDIYRKLERERIENSRRQEKFQRELNQDITFESVDRFSRSKNIKREPEKPRQSLYELLMNRLSRIDTTHIKQKIDVKHNAEDIYGDPRFLQADGEHVFNPSTNNFDTVGEKVDLVLKDGKAFITVKVTAERITPVDFEFNVWRKNQAIVTRTVEVDLLATEHRRQLYYKVMREPAGGSGGGYTTTSNETVLDSYQTLDLFTKILGEGDTEDIEIKTRSGNTTRPFASGMDLLY